MHSNSNNSYSRVHFIARIHQLTDQINSYMKLRLIIFKKRDRMRMETIITKKIGENLEMPLS